jgi:hypothetical protein
VDPAILASLVAIGLLVSAIVAVHFTEWRLYTTMRAERDTLRDSLTAMTADRDGWRSVGERALLVAQLGTRVTKRATRLVSRAPGTKEP